MHIMLLHGFGAPGDDLVPLAEVLDTKATFSFPPAPIDLGPQFFGGRCWWVLDPDVFEHPDRDRSNEIPDGLAAAREHVIKLVEKIDEPLVIGGFSQGAMLACHVAMHTKRPLAGLVLMSATLVARPELAPLVSARRGLRVFQSHGTQDPLLPIDGGERLRDLLIAGGLSVEFHSFRGGHEIPRDVLSKLDVFLGQLIS
jgi:phospholipase/carboxylesterase